MHANRSEAEDSLLTPDAIRNQLDRILSSSDFTSSQQLRRFLRFVFEETLAERSGGIKQYTIAVKTFVCSSSP